MKKKAKKRIVSKEKREKNSVELIKLTRIIAVPIAIKQLEDLASSDERKAIWVLCSGKLTRNQMSSKSGIHLNTVKSFVDIAKTRGLLEEEKEKGGHPKRVIDYVPSDWKKLVKKKEKTPTEQKQEALAQKD